MSRGRPADQPRAEPTSISMSTEDWLWVDQQIEECRARGVVHMNRSRLIRHALRTMDLAQVIESAAGDLVVALGRK